MQSFNAFPLLLFYSFGNASTFPYPRENCQLWLLYHAAAHDKHFTELTYLYILPRVKAVLMRWTDSAQSTQPGIQALPILVSECFSSFTHCMLWWHLAFFFFFFCALFAYCHSFTPYFPWTLGCSSPHHAFKSPPASAPFHELSRCPVFKQSSTAVLVCACLHIYVRESDLSLGGLLGSL